MPRRENTSRLEFVQWNVSRSMFSAKSEMLQVYTERIEKFDDHSTEEQAGQHICCSHATKKQSLYHTEPPMVVLLSSGPLLATGCANSVG